jgi:DNA-binding GntR family transcriptional regulator
VAGNITYNPTGKEELLAKDVDSKEVEDIEAQPEAKQDLPYGNKTSTVVALMHREIMNGALLPGQHLRQDEIANRLGISRVPVREALKAMTSEGVLEHRPNIGHFVKRRSAAELRQITWIRDHCELELARRMDWPDDKTIALMTDLNKQMLSYQASAETDCSEVVDLDVQFHQQLWSCSQDQLFAREVARMWTLLVPYRSFIVYYPLIVQRMHSEHVAIVEALRLRDASGLATALTIHQSHNQSYIELLRKSEESEPR